MLYLHFEFVQGIADVIAGQCTLKRLFLDEINLVVKLVKLFNKTLLCNWSLADVPGDRFQVDISGAPHHTRNQKITPENCLHIHL